MKPHSLLLAGLLISILVLTACNSPGPETATSTPETDTELTQTAAALNLEATLAAPTTTPASVSVPEISQAEFEGVSFSYDRATIAETAPRLQPARVWVPVDQLNTIPISETLPGVPDSIIIDLQPAADFSAETSELSIHSVRNNGQIYPSIANNEPILSSLERLQNAISAGVPPSPFIAGNNGSILETRGKRIDFQNGTGFALLTHPTAATGPDPINGTELVYIYQGLTRDRNFYVALQFPVSSEIVNSQVTPAEAEVQSWASDPQAYRTYVASINQLLAGLPPDAFTPDLRDLDTLIASLRVEPTVPLPPTIEATPTCTDLAQLISETLPDGTTFQPGAPVQKTWTLANAGTCTWTPEYRLIQTGGVSLGYNNNTPVHLDQNVEPGRTIQIAVTLTAPQTEGDYEAQFKLENPGGGGQFGLGANGETPIWIRISVLDLQSNLDLGVPDYLDEFENDRNDWFLNQGEDIGFGISDGTLVLTAINPVGDRWRTAERPPLADFYIEMEATTGSTCTGKDSYGLILRAPVQEDNVIDSGYVFGFSCDGMYRFYRMDNGSFALIQNWSPVSQLRSGPNATNIIGVRADGDVLEVFINGAQVGRFEEFKYYLGLYGLMIRAEGETDFQVLIDRLAYWELP